MSGEDRISIHSAIQREEQSIVKTDSPPNNILVITGITGINILLHNEINDVLSNIKQS